MKTAIEKLEDKLNKRDIDLDKMDFKLDQEIKTIETLVYNDLFKRRQTSKHRSKLPVFPNEHLLTLAETELKVVKELVKIELDTSFHFKDKAKRLESLIMKLKGKND
jgi:hypothetical protein